MDRETLAKAIGNFDRMIELTKEKARLLGEMRDIFLIAQAFDKDPKLIERSGFYPPTRTEYAKWSRIAQARIPYQKYTNSRASAVTGEGCKRVVNNCKLTDGTELRITEPLFLSGAPEVRRGYCKECGIRLPVAHYPDKSPTLCSESDNSRNNDCPSLKGEVPNGQATV